MLVGIIVLIAVSQGVYIALIIKNASYVKAKGF